MAHTEVADDAPARDGSDPARGATTDPGFDTDHDTDPHAAGATAGDTQFDIAFRGYDRAQVDAHISALLERADRAVAALRAARAHPTGPFVPVPRPEAAPVRADLPGLGERVASVLATAEHEARALLADAETEAHALRARAEVEAADTRAAAEQLLAEAYAEAERTAAAAEADAEAALADARARTAEILRTHDKVVEDLAAIRALIDLTDAAGPRRSATSA
ncbi:hypothetical protein [Actinokineospora sp. NBRC 105648]|uniref:hypothetical protein n=1 Tax=Actinokineospora sp. NBRC 105648 TaxID=3032206 RepID=UPI0024A143E4|nr:hypothetical protein [Actinokineospora sp. NBRC 105648]GLZ41883.1 hypothetical protein Acsp05_55070 [Actinokineospora sp. NBRC 105648]